MAKRRKKKMKNVQMKKDTLYIPISAEVRAIRGKPEFSTKKVKNKKGKGSYKREKTKLPFSLSGVLKVA